MGLTAQATLPHPELGFRDLEVATITVGHCRDSLPRSQRGMS